MPEEPPSRSRDPKLLVGFGFVTVEDIKPGADGELNKKLLTQFVRADKKLSHFHSPAILPGKQIESGQSLSRT